MSDKVSLIIPTYFNEESLNDLFQELNKLESNLKSINFSLELIFVDDGSGDNSLQKLVEYKSFRSETKIIKLTRNFGSYLACKEGLRHVTGDCFVLLSADLQDPPSLVFEMVKRWKKGNRFVVCARKTRKDSILKKLFARITYFLIRKFVIAYYPKYGFDLCLLDSSALVHIINSARAIHYSVHFYWLGYKPDIIFYDRIKRKYGKSKWTFYKSVNSALDILLGFKSKFTQFVTSFGLLVSFLSFLWGLRIIVAALAGNIPVPGFASIIVFMSFFFGLVIFYLSLILEYLWRIFGDLNKRSDVIVEKIYD